MKRAVSVALVAVLCQALPAGAADGDSAPDWAVPERGPDRADKDPDRRYTAPGSELALTQAQIDDPFNAPDWFPDEHPPMPDIVEHGIEPDIRACAMCHLASGNGHPQSAKLTGLSATYIARQLEAFKNGDRRSFVGPFIDKLHAIPEEAVAMAAAEWFAALETRPHQAVMETEMVPETHFDSAYMRLVKNGPDGIAAWESIDGRIIEVPLHRWRVKARDPHAFFISYAPPGSVEEGEKIATEGTGKVAACTSCHGPDLRGTPIGPALAGGFATYTIRQIYDFKNGKRTGLADENGIMSAIAGQLSREEIINVAAYIASLEP